MEEGTKIESLVPSLSQHAVGRPIALQLEQQQQDQGLWII